MFFVTKTIKRIHFFNDYSYLINSSDKIAKLNNVQTYIINNLIDITNDYDLLADYINLNLDINDLDTTKKIMLDVLDDLGDYIEPHDVKAKFASDIIFTGKRNYNFPYSIQISLTSRCLHQCIHCYKNASANGDDIDYSTLIDLLEYVQGQTREITFTGGEPFLYTNLEQIMNRFEGSFNFFIETSGYKIENIPIDIMKKFKMIQLSLYGSTADEHDKFTGIKGSFENVTKNIRWLLENNINLLVTTQYKNNDLGRLRKFVEKCIELGIPRIMIGELLPVGRANNLNLMNDYNTSDMQNYIRNLRDEYSKKINIVYDESHKKHDGYNNNFFHCDAGQFKWHIVEDGSITPCALFDKALFSIGKLKNKDYIKIIENKDVYEQIQLKWLNRISEIKAYYRKKETDIFRICENINNEYWERSLNENIK